MIRPFVLLAALAILCVTAFAHPKPGAHADIRITIDGDAVRCDMVMNILFADQLVRTRRDRSDNVLDAEIPALSDALNEYFGAARAGPVPAVLDRANRVLIDGFEVAPLVKTLRIIRPEPEIRPGFVQNPALLLPQIHVQLEYPFKTPPRSVALLWGTYPRDFIRPDRDEAPISDVEAVLIAAGSLDLIKFTRTEPEFIWHAPASASSRFVAVPDAPRAPEPAASPPMLFLAAAGLAGALLVLTLASSLLGAKAGLAAGLPVRAGCLVLAVVSGGVAVVSWKGSRAPDAPALDDEQVLAIFGPLHANIYRAFDYTRDTEIFDALARSVDGPLLDKVYDEIYRGLIMQEEGGALSRVKQVTLSETTVLAPTPGDTATPARYGIKARWKVDGIVYHWGHAHERTNEYTAEYRIAQGASGWRIVDLKPLEQRRIETEAQANSAASVTAPAQKESGVWNPQR